MLIAFMEVTNDNEEFFQIDQAKKSFKSSLSPL